jgi:hypothetical protein
MTSPVRQAHPKIADTKGVTIRPSIDHSAAVVRLIDAMLGGTTTTREPRQPGPQD